MERGCLDSLNAFSEEKNYISTEFNRYLIRIAKFSKSAVNRSIRLMYSQYMLEELILKVKTILREEENLTTDNFHLVLLDFNKIHYINFDKLIQDKSYKLRGKETFLQDASFDDVEIRVSEIVGNSNKYPSEFYKKYGKSLLNRSIYHVNMIDNAYLRSQDMFIIVEVLLPEEPEPREYYFQCEIDNFPMIKKTPTQPLYEEVYEVENEEPDFKTDYPIPSKLRRRLYEQGFFEVKDGWHTFSYLKSHSDLLKEVVPIFITQKENITVNKLNIIEKQLKNLDC